MTDQDLKIITAHLRGELSETAQEAFLKRLSSDTEFKEAYLLEKAQFEVLAADNWTTASKVDPEFDKFHKAAKSESVRSLARELETRSNSKGRVRSLYRRPYFKWAAAVVLVALVLGSLFLGAKEDPQTLYAQYIDLDDIPYLTVRSDSDSIYSILEQEFRSENYDDFLNLLEQQDELNPNASIYLYEGMAHIALNNNTKALSVFETLIASDLMDAPRGYWFKALALLKSGKIDEAKDLLSYIDDNNLYNSDKAKELLRELP